MFVSHVRFPAKRAWLFCTSVVDCFFAGKLHSVDRNAIVIDRHLDISYETYLLAIIGLLATISIVGF